MKKEEDDDSKKEGKTHDSWTEFGKRKGQRKRGMQINLTVKVIKK